MSKLYRYVLTLALTTATGWTIGMTLGIEPIVQNNPNLERAESSETSSQEELFGLAEYIRLQPGMSLTDAEAILGRGIEKEATETTSIYEWKQPNGSTIAVLFEHGILKKKSQENLQ